MTGQTGFKAYLLRLGFTAAQLEDVKKSFNYRIGINPGNASALAIEFIHTEENKLADIQLDYWNKNNCEVLVAVTDSRTYVIDPKEKPRLEAIEGKVSRYGSTQCFEYGVNTEFDPVQLKGIRRTDIDNTEFFQLIYDRQRSARHSVSKDLLLNLIALRDDLSTAKNEHAINVLILRCLFIKYLEDRKIIEEPNFLVSNLDSGDPKKILKAFNKIRKINGDLFKKNQLDESLIKVHHLRKLKLFFSCYNYADEQGTLFPYQFDKIPVEVISNIYEAFLKNDERKENSVYYTPDVLVRFMANEVLTPVLSEKPSATVLDPACGSGSYLVESYKRIIAANQAEKSFNRKVEILQDQIFGIDIDENSLVIAAFSLYLTLLEDIKPEFVRKKIKEQSPLLPSLLSKNLIKANALVDDVHFGNEGIFLNNTKGFDCILANPPWGSADEGSEENLRIRKAIGTDGKKGTMPEYAMVSDVQKSQAFLLRAAKWGHDKTRISFVVNNSVFFNEKADKFRKHLLEKYTVDKFYECSDINKILFRQHTLGKVRGQEKKVGANEPCCVLVMSAKPANTEHVIQYITPRLTKLSEHFNLIHFSELDVKPVFQEDLKVEDKLWRVFVHGSWQSYQLINHCYEVAKNNLVAIECRSGFKAEANMKPTGKAKMIPWIDIEDIRGRYNYVYKKREFNWNQELERKRSDEVFVGERILYPVRPLVQDEFKLRGIFIEDSFVVHKHNISAIKVKFDNQTLALQPYLAILNSSLIGYILYLISPQWGKGDTRRGNISNSIIQDLPIPYLSPGSDIYQSLFQYYHQLVRIKITNHDADISGLEAEIDELVFRLYKLTDYNKEVIREFYEVNVQRKENPDASDNDLNLYATKFKSVFSSVLEEDATLNVSFDKYLGLTTVMKFEAVSKKHAKPKIVREAINFAPTVGQKQMKKALKNGGLLNEQPIKIYDKECFYIVKPNHIAHWTIKQAMDDANEEIANIIKSLPEE